MKKLAVAIAVAVACGGAVSTVSAETYLGGKIGYAWVDDSCVSGFDCEDDSVGLGAFLGYNFTDYLGIEGGYDFLGEYQTSFAGSTSSSKDNLHAFSVAPKLTYPINDQVSIFGKVGAAYMDLGDANDTVLTAGIGGEYLFTNNLAARLEYQYFDEMSDGIVKDMSANFVSLGLTYRFGGAEEPVPMAKEEPVEQMAEPEPAPVEEVVTSKQVQEQFDSGLFAHNSAELSAEGKASLATILETLTTHPQASATIVGHTDSSGSEKYNQDISERRAQAVADYLIGEGVNPEQVVASGEGELNPIASNDTAEGRSQNRRVEVDIPSFEYEEAPMK